ncbi:MAG: hypothetical protein RMN25_10040 [Anaerolineae bacterium]|nr:hypothetical protein [Thermoflexales bacterium]MDW8408109.1 hypothetical protein [Anaerolineae bacterium]
MQTHARVFVAVTLSTLGIAMLSRPPSLHAQTPAPAQRAGVVIQYAAGTVETRCVEFDEPHISGYDLLRRSGLRLKIAADSFGAAICKIGDVGCDYPAQSCFCRCENVNATCVYWISFVQSDGVWKYATLGASNTTVKDGDLQAWVWGAGQGENAPRPPAITIEEVCGVQMREADEPSIQPNAPAKAAPEPAPAPTAPTPPSSSAQRSHGEAGSLAAFGGIAIGLVLILLFVNARRRKDQSAART